MILYFADVSAPGRTTTREKVYADDPADVPALAREQAQVGPLARVVVRHFNGFKV